MDIFKIKVIFGTEVVDVGQCDSDHISLILLIRATIHEVSGKDEVPDEDCLVWIHLPWCGERVQVNSDSELIEFFQVFRDHGLGEIVFELEKTCNVPSPPEGSTSRPNEEAEVLDQHGGYQALGWCDSEAEMLNYDGDSEKDDDKDVEDVEDGEEEGRQTNEGQNMQYDKVPVFEEEFVDGDDDIIKECMDLFEGYQSKSNDEYFSDSELEPEQVRIAKLMKGIPFKKMVGGEIKFEVGQTFDNAKQMREVFREYAIQEGVALSRVKNDLLRQTYKCKEAGCPWRAHGSRLLDKMTFMIKTLVDTHECHRIYNSKEAKVSWIASKFEDLVRRNPSICVKVISDLLRERYKVSVDSQRLYKAKRRALEGLLKDHATCFSKLRRYAYMVSQSNPGSAFHISTQQPQPTFHRLFLSFKAQKLGFLEGCRPFIGVDGCHLKGPYGGVLLSTVALDANSGLFPLAVCICEKETQDSWEWFLHNLKIHLKYPSDRPLTFMSDRQKGVIHALQEHFPLANRSRSSNVFDFKEAMDEIGGINPAAKSWLQEIEPKHWSRHAYDQTIRCDHVTNNMTEAFNSMLGTHRASSYLELLEFIRRMVMRKFQDRKEECEQWNSALPPRVNAKILKNSKESRVLTIIAAGNKEYEVLGPNEGYVIKLGEYSCQCGSWQVSGIPCRHAMAAISHHCGKAAVKDKITAYVHQSLTKSAYMQTYNGMIHPILDQNRWLEVPACILVEGQTEHIDPPPRTVQPGRPKILRKREQDEGPKGGKSGTVTCKICNQVGHNKRTCKNILTAALIPHEHFRFLNLIIPPLMAIVELDDVSMIVLDALDLCCLYLLNIAVVG
ncbi:hypothetical protein EZV62_016702 [Acer yangbiense]|uniref:SWIM-type domain-containing protein n=1 Tax=Acer yangbiense TaxID=1000413 RepID=A0A5C7HP81_9ROSI|nr:hypothetical protein EZV62_016702 [Acer yangbiense]